MCGARFKAEMLTTRKPLRGGPLSRLIELVISGLDAEHITTFRTQAL